MPSKIIWFNQYGDKRCCTCKEYRDPALFHSDKSGHGGLAFSCKTCANDRSNKRHRNLYGSNLEYTKMKNEAYLKARWGFGRQEYESRLAAQSGCAICEEASPANWHLDHCHSTGQVREFLCGNCNRGLGQFRDDVVIMQKAIDYLLKHRALVKENATHDEC